MTNPICCLAQGAITQQQQDEAYQAWCETMSGRFPGVFKKTGGVYAVKGTWSAFWSIVRPLWVTQYPGVDWPTSGKVTIQLMQGPITRATADLDEFGQPLREVWAYGIDAVVAEHPSISADYIAELGKAGWAAVAEEGVEVPAEVKIAFPDAEDYGLRTKALAGNGEVSLLSETPKHPQRVFV